MYQVQLVLSPPSPHDVKSLLIEPSPMIPFPHDWIFLPIQLMHKTAKNQDPAPEDLATELIKSILSIVLQWETNKSQCNSLNIKIYSLT
jgi:hypothetical protein